MIPQNLAKLLADKRVLAILSAAGAKQSEIDHLRSLKPDSILDARQNGLANIAVGAARMLGLSPDTIESIQDALTSKKTEGAVDAARDAASPIIVNDTPTNVGTEQDTLADALSEIYDDPAYGIDPQRVVKYARRASSVSKDEKARQVIAALLTIFSPEQLVALHDVMQWSRTYFMLTVGAVVTDPYARQKRSFGNAHEDLEAVIRTMREV